MEFITYIRNIRSRLRPFIEAAIIPSIFSTIMMLSTSPFMFYDGVDILNRRLMVIPHFPPLYPQVVEIFHYFFGTSHKEIVALLGLQHVMLILSIAYFATSQPRTQQRVVVAILLSVGVYLGLLVHGVATESIGIPLLIFAMGAFVRIATHGACRTITWIIYGSALLLAVLTKYSFIVFGSVLPLYFVLRLLFEKRNRSQQLGQFILSSLLLIIVYTTSHGIQNAYCYFLGKDSTSVMWRAGVYRMHEIGQTLSDTERLKWISELQARTNEPQVAVAIKVMVEETYVWPGTLQKLASHPALKGANVEDIANRAFLVFLKSPDHNSINQWMGTFKSYFWTYPNQETYGQHIWHIWNAPPAYGMTKEVMAQLEYEKITTPPPIVLDVILKIDRISSLYLICISLAIFIIVFLGDRGSVYLYTAGCTLIMSIAYAAVMSTMTVWLHRYGVPVTLLAWLTLALLASFFFDNKKI